MKCKAILSIAVALMIASVGCFAALGPSDSNDASDGSLMLASSTLNGELSNYTDGNAIVVYMPGYDEESGTYSSKTDFIELTYDPTHTIYSYVPGGETKVEDIKYYPSTVAGITEHYDGKMIYISNSDIHKLSDSTGTVSSFLTAILGGGVPAMVITLVATALTSNIGMIDSMYPDGIAYAVGTDIYLTRNVTIPIVPIIIGVLAQGMGGGRI